MSFKDLHLPDIVIADLFKKSLIQPEAHFKKEEKSEKTKAPTIEVSPAPLSINYLGNNLKKIALVVYYPEHTHMPEDHLNFLINVLKACNLTIADIAIINVCKQPLDFNTLQTTLKTDKLVNFGVEESQFSINMEWPLYTVQQNHGVMLFKTPGIVKLNQKDEESKLHKTKLWLCLKELFQV